MHPGQPHQQRKRGFTLLEVLVASAILMLMVVLLASAIGTALATVRRSNSKIDQFAATRAGFDSLTAILSQATLNTYWDYDNPTTPTNYIRKSDLHFLITNTTGDGGQSVFFQAPLARSGSTIPLGVLNAVGYWVEFGDDTWKPGHVIINRPRYRLIQGIQPTESLAIFTNTTATWINGIKSIPTPAFPLADNVIALILWPRRPTAQDSAGTELTADYTYDSRTGTDIQKAQLPPSVQVTMIVIDEASAIRITSGNTEPAVIQNALKNRFRDVTQYQTDLDAVKSALTTARINYLVLSSPVTLRESKWSQK
ncbi:MAG: prepilin-type N-terminal cleavage/methylation domain-containing protein [Chthoniobacteraceae bacterium]